MALRAEQFLLAAREHLAPLRGTHIHDQVLRDLLDKTEQADAGYGRWLGALLPWLAAQCGLERPPRVLDFGCGSGELAVLTNSLGFETTGVDVHADHLRLARILAAENGMPEERFVLSEGGPLPFADGAFDVVTLHSVLEHLGDEVLEQVLPEIARVCSGAVFLLAPNRLKTRDDHTGLAFVPWLPRGLAGLYIRACGPRYRYGISQDGSWDVHYRTFDAIRRRFERHGFAVGFVPDELVYPPLDRKPPLYAHVAGSLGKRALLAPFRVAIRLVISLGRPRQAFYPYLALVAWRRKQ